MKIVEVVWRDHATRHGWTAKLSEPVTIREIGYLAEETDEYYCLVDSEVTDDPEASRWGCSTAVLKTDVISIKEMGQE